MAAVGRVCLKCLVIACVYHSPPGSSWSVPRHALHCLFLLGGGWLADGERNLVDGEVITTSVPSSMFASCDCDLLKTASIVFQLERTTKKYIHKPVSYSILFYFIICVRGGKGGGRGGGGVVT